MRRGARLGVRHQQPQSSKLVHGGIRYLEQLDFRLVREALIERGLLLQRIAPHLVKPVRFLYPLTKPVFERALHRRRHAALRPVQLHRPAPAGVPHHRHLTKRQLLRAVPSLASGRLHRRAHLLRRPGRRRALRREPRPHRELLRRPRREPRPGRGVRQGRPARRRRRRRTTSRPASTSRSCAKQVVNATGVWTDDTQAMVGERGQFKVRASQGRPPRRAARPVPVEARPAAAHREERAVRHPVGPALAHRHDRHRLESRQGASRRDRGRHRLPARARQHGARRAAHARRRRGRLRGPAPAARRREPTRPAKLSREHIVAHTRARARRRRRRQVDHLPDHGEGCDRRGRARRSTARSVESRSPRTSRCSAPRATRRRGTSAAKIAQAFGVHKVRIEHLLNRYGVHDRRAARPAPRAPRTAVEPLPGADDYIARRGRLRGDARGRTAPRRRARPPHAHLDRGLGSRGLGRAGRRRAHGEALGWDAARVRARDRPRTSARVEPSARARSSPTTSSADRIAARPRRDVGRSRATSERSRQRER